MIDLLIILSIGLLSVDGKMLCTHPHHTIGGDHAPFRISDVLSASECVIKCIDQLKQCRSVVFIRTVPYDTSKHHGTCRLFAVNTQTNGVELMPTNRQSTVYEIRDYCSQTANNAFDQNVQLDLDDVIRTQHDSLLPFANVNTGADTPIEKAVEESLTKLESLQLEAERSKTPKKATTPDSIRPKMVAKSRVVDITKQEETATTTKINSDEEKPSNGADEEKPSNGADEEKLSNGADDDNSAVAESVQHKMSSKIVVNEDKSDEKLIVESRIDETSERTTSGVSEPIRPVNSLPCSTGNCKGSPYCPNCQSNNFRSSSCGGQLPCGRTLSGHWSEWVAGACSMSCGSGGTCVRSRSCSVPGGCIGPDRDHQPCFNTACPSQQSNWAQWTNWMPPACPSCGGGTISRSRTRLCIEGLCSGESSQIQPCIVPPCAQWSDWNSWQPCPVSCGGGEHQRTRVCQNGFDCEGPRIETRRCCDWPCPAFSPWTEWSTCTASCGTGSQRRTRHCNDGQSSNACIGAPFEERICDAGVCPVWSEWSQFGACSQSCGGGSCIRNRTCLNGVDCPGNAEESRECNMNPCAVWSDWTDWTECSSTCGQGHQIKRRSCLQGRYCHGPSQEMKFCLAKSPCPSWTKWSEWSSCSAACGQGVCSRRRECVTDSESAPTESPIDHDSKSKSSESISSQRITVGVDEHPTVAPSTTTSKEDAAFRELLKNVTNRRRAQSASVGRRPTVIKFVIGGRHRRQLSSIMVRPHTTGCIGPDFEQKPCQTSASCQCEWSEWSTSSPCTVTCGIGTKSRSRYCGPQQNQRLLERNDFFNQRRIHGVETYAGMEPIRNQLEFFTLHRRFRRQFRQNVLCSCPGESVQTESCDTQQICPASIPGDVGCNFSPCMRNVQPQMIECVWSQWTQWSQCLCMSCRGGGGGGDGGPNRRRQRERTCGDGMGRCVGRCPGQQFETSSCDSNSKELSQESQSECQWSEWQKWSACSVTCGVDGEMTRRRRCPCASCGGGSVSETKLCDDGVQEKKCSTNGSGEETTTIISTTNTRRHHFL